MSRVANDTRVLTALEHELVAERWIEIGDPTKFGQWHWSHGPTRRSITLRLDEPGWHVFVVLHDEHGNPVGLLHTFLVCNGTCDECRAASATLGPFGTLEEAAKAARAVRRSIEAEVRVVPMPTQVSLFADAKKGGDA